MIGEGGRGNDTSSFTIPCSIYITQQRLPQNQVGITSECESACVLAQVVKRTSSSVLALVIKITSSNKR